MVCLGKRPKLCARGVLWFLVVAVLWSTAEGVSCNTTQWGSWSCLCPKGDRTARTSCLRSRKSVANTGSCETEFRSGDLCCKTDCKYTMTVSPCYGGCSAKGVKYNIYTISVKDDCKGKPCPVDAEIGVPKTDKENPITCQTDCCRTDCVLKEWTTWSACSNPCGKGTWTRHRTLIPASCNGTCSLKNLTETQSCETTKPLDCQVSSWGTWGACIPKKSDASGPCGIGTKKRNRTVVSRELCGGLFCPSLDDAVDCPETRCCKADCVWDWSQWSACSVNCGTGVRSRTQIIKVKGECGGVLCSSIGPEQESCENSVKKDCVLGQWAPWSGCSNDCGTGYKDTRRSIVSPAYCGGACTEPTYKKLDGCVFYNNTHCTVTQWTQWSKCVTDCTGGLKFRKRSVIVPSYCNGQKCTLLDQSNCNLPTCRGTLSYCKNNKCACFIGALLFDNVTCSQDFCPEQPKAYCPSNIGKCGKVNFDCKESPRYARSICKVKGCKDPTMELKGQLDVLPICLGKKYSDHTIYCIPKNQGPTLIHVYFDDELRENTPRGTCVATITVKDDLGTPTVTLSYNPDNRLYIKPQTHLSELCLNKVPNYEESKTWEFGITATDPGGLSLSKNFSVAIKDMSEPPKDFKVTPNVIPENSPKDKVVGVLSAAVEAIPYTMLLADDDNAFTMYKEGGLYKLKVKGNQDEAKCATKGGQWCTLNYEKAAVRTIILVVEDNAGEKKDEVVEIKLTDVNDNPTQVKTEKPEFPEASVVGTPFARLITVDEDKDQTYTYNMVQDKHGIFGLAGDNLTSSKVFDFEKDGPVQFEVTVKSTDSGTPPKSVESIVMFKLSDSNELPYALEINPSGAQVNFPTNKPKVRENSPKGTKVGVVTVKDIDKDDILTLTLTPASGTPKVEMVTPLSCQSVKDVNTYCTATLGVAGVLDFEKEPSTKFKLTAKDKGGLSLELQVELLVLDVNEPPTEMKANGKLEPTLTIEENKNDAVIATLTGVDPDANSAFTFSLTDDAGGRFIIPAGTNELKTNAQANLDADSATTSYKTTVKVLDNGTPPLEFQKTYTVTVTDANEAPTAVTASTYEVAENQSPGVLVAKLTATDPDNAQNIRQTFTYTLVTSALERFRISGDTLVVGDSTKTCGNVQCTIDYEKDKQHSLQIKVTDNGKPPMSSTFTVDMKVKDTNDAPTDFAVSSLEVFENEAAGREIGVVSAKDEDAGQTLTYTLVQGKENAVLQGNTLVTTKVFNYETTQSFSVVLAAKDDGTPPLEISKTFTINVKNVNEAVVCAVQQDVSVDEDAAVGQVVATLTFSDADLNEKMTVTQENENNVFEVANPNCVNQKNPEATKCTVHFKLKSKVDYETQSSYLVNVNAKDAGGLECTTKVKVTVGDKNDAPTGILTDGSTKTELRVTEGFLNPISIQLSAVDQDAKDTHTYAIRNAASLDKIVKIENNILKILPNTVLDFETKPQLSLTIEAKDSGGLMFAKAYVIQVLDANDPPSGITMSATTVDENSALDTVVGTLSATDPDTGTTFSYKLIASAGGRFKVDGDKVKVAEPNTQCLAVGGTACRLNFEATPSYTIKVEVFDSGQPPLSLEKEFTITINDVNDPVRMFRIDGLEVQDEAKADTKIGTFYVEDEDKSQTHTYTLISVQGGGDFNINAGALYKTTNLTLDPTKTHKVNVKVADSGSPVSEITRAFDLVVVKGGLLIQSTTFTSEGGSVVFQPNKAVVKENSAVGTVIGTLEYDMRSATTNLKVELIGEAKGILVLGSVTTSASKVKTTVKVSGNIDYEQKKLYRLLTKVTADEGGGSREYTLLVEGVNEKPTDLSHSDQTLDVEEGANNKPISRFSAKDPDFGDTHTYTLVNDAGGKFAMSSDGTLRTTANANLDYETQDTYTIKVQTKDSGGLTFEKDFTVKVKDLNEKPKQPSLSHATVEENSAVGTVVGTLQATDPDNAKTQRQTLAFSVIDSAGGRFKLNGGNKLVVAAPNTGCLDPSSSTPCLLDYEAKQTHNVIVRVTDNGTPTPQWSEATLTITLTNVNDKPHTPKLSSNRVSETPRAVGTVIGALSATDQDVGQTQTFSVVGAGSTYFEIKNGDLVLKSAVDYEVQSSHKVGIQVTDDGTPPKSATAEFTIGVLDVKEKPTSLTWKASGSASTDLGGGKLGVKENTALGTVVAKLTVLDPDKGETITLKADNSYYTLEKPTCSPKLQNGVSSTSCVADVKLAVALNYEKVKEYKCTLTAADSGGLELSNMFTMQVQNAEDPPTAIIVNNDPTVSVLTVAENSQGVEIAKLTTVDEDAAQTHTYSHKGGDKKNFAVSSTGSVMVSSTANLDFETAPAGGILLTLQSSDGTYTVDKDVRVKITDVNELPEKLLKATFQLPENAKPGFIIGKFATTDPDNVISIRQTFTYRLVDTLFNKLALNGDKLIVGTKPVFDFEKGPKKLNAKIGVTDSGLNAKEVMFTIVVEVTDANDQPTNLRMSGTTIPEDAGLGTAVGTLLADDEDAGQTLSYAVTNDAQVPFGITGNKVVVDGALDYELQRLVTVIATATDSGSPQLTTQKQFQITVTNVDEPIRSATLTLGSTIEADYFVEEGQPIGNSVGVVEATDPDANEKMVATLTQITGGVLKIEPGQCKRTDVKYETTKCSFDIQVAKPITFVSDATIYKIIINVSDSSSAKIITSNFKIKNKNHVPTNIRLSKSTVLENAAGSNAMVGVLHTDDPDGEDTHTYTLVSTGGTASFTIIRETGTKFALKAIDGVLDYETTPEVEVIVKSVDSGKPPLSIQKKLKVTVGNVNEKPVISGLSNNQVGDQSAAGTIIGRVLISDPDNKNKDVQKHTCEFGTPSSSFVMDNATLTIKLAKTLQTNKNKFTVVVQCEDDGTPSLKTDAKTFDILVKASPDVPKYLKLDQNTVAENLVTVVGTLSLINEQTEAPLQATGLKYTLNTNKDKFVLDGDKVKTKNNGLNFETNPLIPLQVEATGKYLNKAFSVKQTYQILVTDVNDQPTAIDLKTSYIIPENSAIATIVGSLSTVDEDSGQNHTYKLEGIDKGVKSSAANVQGDPTLATLFKLSGTRVLVNGDVNYETSPDYSLKISSTDDGTPPLAYTGVVVVKVKNENEAPTAIAPTSLQIMENSPANTVVGTLAVTDEDKGDTHKCSISKIGLLPNFPFTMTGFNIVVNKPTIDHERTGVYKFDVVCEDQAGLTLTKSIHVFVNDTNEPPYNMRTSVPAVPEDTPKGGIAAVLQADDHEGNKVTFTAVIEDNAFVVKGDSTLLSNVVLDYEKKRSYTLDVTATDEGGLVTKAKLVLGVTNVNEAPTNFTLDATNVRENAKVGTVVGTLTITDEDKGQSHVCSIPSTVPLRVVGPQNKVEVSGTIDHEKTDKLAFPVTCEDNGTPKQKLTKTLVLIVDDVNEPPETMSVSQTTPTPEHSPQDTVAATITVDDPDVQNVITCVIQPINAPFRVINVDKVKNILHLVVKGVLNYEKAKEYNLTVICNDGEFNIKKSAVIAVSDVNDAPTAIILLNPAPIASTSDPGYPISHLKAVDPDSGQTHTFTLPGVGSDLMEIQGTLLRLKKTIPADMLKVAQPKLPVEIRTIDNGQPSELSFTQTFQIPVTLTSKEPAIVLSDNTVLENASVGSTVATFELKNMRDLSSGYKIVLVNEANVPFSVTGLNLILKAKLAYHVKSAYTLTVDVNYVKYKTVVIHQDFIITVIETNVCTPKCPTDGYCQKASDGTAKCECNAGFDKVTGPPISCNPHDDCTNTTTPCKNGGTCQDGLMTFTCKCADGWEGSTCEIKVVPEDPCKSNPCKNNGNCAPLTKGFQCVCRPGWTGTKCETNIDDCVNAKCFSGGVCKDLVNNYKCACPAKRGGCNCEYDTTACTQTSCPGKICSPRYNKAGTLCLKKSIRNMLKVFRRSTETRSDLIRWMCRKFRNGKTRQALRKLRKVMFSAIRYYVLPVSGSNVQKRSVGSGYEPIDFVAFTDDGDAFVEIDVIRAMKNTCDEENDTGAVCEAIRRRYVELMGTSGGFPLYPVIGGAIGGAILLAIIIIVTVILIKKRKTDKPAEAEAKSGADTR